MIKYRARVHDKFSIELKMWYYSTSDRLDRFRLENWIFLPASLDINALSYTREQFYSDIKNYFRNITPVFGITELGSVSGQPEIVPNPLSPMDYLTNSVVNVVNYPTKQNIAEFEYQIKMFCAIFKSAAREEYNGIKRLSPQSDSERERSGKFLEILYSVLLSYESIASYLESCSEKKYYNLCSFGEEFIINLAGIYAGKIYNYAGASRESAEWMNKINGQRYRRGYSAFTKEGGYENARLLHRLSLLKKYVESDLFLSVDKRKSGVLKEQVWYSVAAGLSMIFATAVAFTFQQKYGNFTMPLFVALVISYMLKDRIKELVRSVFSSNRKLKYFDNKTLFRVKESRVGLSREGFDFVPQSKVPEGILALRNRSALVDMENRISEESVLFYRNLTCVDGKRLKETSEYDIEGLNHILLLNFSSFIKKMDNPGQPYNIYEEQTGMVQLLVDKIYYINLIFQFTSSSGELSRVRYRVAMSRSGIISVDEITP